MTWKYKCGHESNGIIMDNNPLSFIAWEEWSKTVGVNGDMSQCFDCWCKERDKHIIVHQVTEKERRGNG